MTDDEIDSTLRHVSKVCCVFCGEWLHQDEGAEINIESEKHVGRKYRFYAHRACFMKLAKPGPGVRGLSEL